MAVCASCSDPLVVEIDFDDDEAGSSTIESPPTVPDELTLSCGCKFHWQCLLDESSRVAVSLSCPVCKSSLAASAGSSSTGAMTARPRILTRYVNEGGVQEDLDIMPLIVEEAYLEAHPAARPGRALLTMCSEGDVDGIVELLQNVREDAEDQTAVVELLRYQDHLDGMQSALHVAVEKEQHLVVWLLLWLSSTLPTDVFPTELRREAEKLGLDRQTAVVGQDIRTLKNESGQTAGAVAETMGQAWRAMIASGLL